MSGDPGPGPGDPGLPQPAPEPGPPDDVDLLAARLRADRGDLETYERVVLSTLADALPAGVVEVERVRSVGDRVAGRPGRAVAIRIRLGDETLELASAHHGLVARIARDVRGVTISRREVTVEEWSRRLAELLAALAAANAAARDALGRLLGAP